MVTFSGVALACVACVVELLCVTYQVLMEHGQLRGMATLLAVSTLLNEI